MAVIDIVVISVLVLFSVIGMVKGILNTIVSLFGNLACISLAVIAAKPVSKFLDSIFGIVQKIGDKIAGSLTTITPFQSGIEAVGDNVLTGAELKEYMPSDSLYHRALKLFVEDSKSFTLGEGEGAAATADAEVVSYIGAQIGKILAIVIAAVVIFILLRVAILLLAKLFNALGKNRAIGGLDRSVGFLFGLLKGAILVSLALGIFYLIANETVNGWIEGSTFTKWMYNYICQFIDFLATKFNLPSVITNLFPQIGASALTF